MLLGKGLNILSCSQDSGKQGTFCVTHGIFVITTWICTMGGWQQLQGLVKVLGV